jgi:hypothetical protein
MTQFGRALHELNIDILCSNEPQATDVLDSLFDGYRQNYGG